MFELAVHPTLSIVVRYRRALSSRAVVEEDLKQTWGFLSEMQGTGLET